MGLWLIPTTTAPITLMRGCSFWQQKYPATHIHDNGKTQEMQLLTGGDCVIGERAKPILPQAL